MFLVLKWTLFVIVLGFVANKAMSMWQRDGATLSGLTIRWSWIFAAVIVNTLAWLPSVWFWRKLMERMGGRLPFLATARAYYCGHLGKYVPGKAAVVVIRAGLVRQYGVRSAPAALAVTYETLAMMGSGAAIAAALAPQLISESLRAGLPAWLREIVDRPWLLVVLVLVLTAALLPVLAEIFTRLAKRMTPADALVDGEPVRIDAWLLAQGLLAYVVTWILHGICLDMSLRAIGATGVGVEHLPALIGAMAFATVAGFAVLFAPGGLGVREGLLIAALGQQTYLSPSEAVAAAVLTRLIGFATEILASAVLYYGVRPKANPSAE